jgi:voltage-gated potassium channel
VLNIIAIIIESIPYIGNIWRDEIEYFEITSVIIFTIEYLIRIYVSDITHPSSSRLKSAIKFICSPYGIIDLLAIAPFYMPFIFAMDLRFLRLLRLLRFLRILKINRYNRSLYLIWNVIKEKKSELLTTVFVTSIMLLIASFLIHYFEAEAQPEQFSNILNCFWWSVATLTTVGYGDIYPITAAGKLIAGIIAIMGIGLVALPTGIISSGFIDKLSSKKENTCPHCGKELQ